MWHIHTGAAGMSLPWLYVVSNTLPLQGSKVLFPPCSSKYLVGVISHAQLPWDDDSQDSFVSWSHALSP